MSDSPGSAVQRQAEERANHEAAQRRELEARLAALEARLRERD